MAKSSVKRFGSRYGRRVRDRVAEVEAKTNQYCPYCRSTSVKRQAVGIWNCKKCNSKFTGGAYKVE